MSFDVLAPHYRWMELFLAGEKLQRCRTAFLDQTDGVRDVLLLGEGHGRFLVECRRRLPSASITCVDASERMLDVARARLKQAGLGLESITFVHADILRWQPRGNTADLLATHFFLDCFPPNELRALIGKLADAARPKGRWLLADFQVPSSGLARLRARIILQAMYIFFRAVTRLPAKKLTPADAFIRNCGFELRARRVTEWGLLRSDYWVRN